MCCAVYGLKDLSFYIGVNSAQHDMSIIILN